MQRKYKKEPKTAPKTKIPGLKIALRSVCAVLLICLGGFLFNIDRMGNFGITLLQHKEFLPSIVHRFLPGGTAVFGTALPHQELAGQVIEVYDGDTITLLAKENKKYRVRFYAIDAPEAAQENGIESRDALRQKILGKNVTVKVAAVDRYQRVVGKVMEGERYINLEMVKEGMAWYYSDYAPRQFSFMDAELQARMAKKGLWESPNPEPPWKWRRNNK